MKVRLRTDFQLTFEKITWLASILFALSTNGLAQSSQAQFKQWGIGVDIGGFWAKNDCDDLNMLCSRSTLLHENRALLGAAILYIPHEKRIWRELYWSDFIEGNIQYILHTKINNNISSASSGLAPEFKYDRDRSFLIYLGYEASYVFGFQNEHPPVGNNEPIDLGVEAGIGFDFEYFLVRIMRHNRGRLYWSLDLKI